MSSPTPAAPEVGAYRPLSRRRRLLIVALAVATAVAVVTMLFDPPGGVQRTKPVPAASPAASPPSCAPGQTSDCVGGTSAVIVPAAPAGPTGSR